MTKQELIKEAWCNQCLDEIDKNGWVNIGYCVNRLDDVELWLANNYFKRNVNNWEIDYSELDNGEFVICRIRPKSLQGIENNNGWIKIESENMILPIDGTEVHFYHSFTNENGVQTEYHKGIFNAALGFTSYYDSENYKINEVTHYQLIVEQKPPLY